MALPKEAPLYRALGLVLTGGNGLEECGLKAPEAFDANKEQDPSNMHSRNLQEKKKLDTFAYFGRKLLDALTTHTRNYHQA